MKYEYKHPFNSYPVNWSVEKAKKESKKGCKNFLGVIDFDE